MAYHSTYGTAANTLDVMVKLQEFLTNTAGWTLHDDRMSQSSYFVVKSHGESGKEDVYVQFLDDENTDMVSVKPVLYWDAVNHVGIKEAFQSGATAFATMDADQFLYWFFADLDHLFVVTKIASTYRGMYVGSIRRFWSDAVAVTEQYADSGSNRTVAVDDASVLTAGRNYIIKDNGGIEPVIVSAVDTSSTPNTVTIASLSRGYTVGAKIGEDPQPVIVFSPGMPWMGNQFYALNHCYGYEGASSQYGNVFSLGQEIASYSDRDSRYGYVAMFPFVAAHWIYGVQGESKEVRGELIETFAVGPNAGLSEDTIDIGGITYKIFNLQSLGWCAVKE